MYPERVGMLAAALVFFGFIVTFVPQFLLGNGGMPRRYYDYPAQFQTLHVISTVGSWVLALGMLVAGGSLFWAWVKGDRAPANPWGSRSFEWRTSSPPPSKNFRTNPVFEIDAYDYTQPLPSDPETEGEGG
jgi:cytochrome c oxidase subunit 1